MARDTRSNFLAELARVSPQISDAFERAILDVRSTAQQRAIEEAIRRAVETGDIWRGVQEVRAALQLGHEFFAPLDKAISDAFEAGAVWQLSTLPKKPLPNTGPLLVRFQGRHPRAEAWARTNAAALITEITEDTEEVIRETLTEAVQTSRPYRRVARDLVGQTEGNERRGGLIGLHSRQARAVRNARADLEALDPAYFQRTLRDKRFDPTVRAAIREGKPLSAADVDRITGRYADRLLQARGKMISRTEGNKAMNAGRAEAMTQMIESGKVQAEAVTKIWDATPGPRTRDSHRMLNGTAVGWNGKFISPITGAAMDWPHDETAPPEEVVNCRCSCRFRVDWRAVAEARERELA